LRVVQTFAPHGDEAYAAAMRAVLAQLTRGLAVEIGAAVR